MLTCGDDEALIAWNGNQDMLAAGWLAVLKDREKGLRQLVTKLGQWGI